MKSEHTEMQPTCGSGLAEHSELPAKLGQLATAMAQNLESHMIALDLRDHNSKKEQEAYLHLTKEYRSVASQLAQISRHMAGYRDLPMGRHDTAVMLDPKLVGAFEKLVTAEEELITLLQKFVEQHRKMLTEVRTASGGAR